MYWLFHLCLIIRPGKRHKVLVFSITSYYFYVEENFQAAHLNKKAVSLKLLELGFLDWQHLKQNDLILAWKVKPSVSKGLKTKLLVTKGSFISI